MVYNKSSGVDTAVSKFCFGQFVVYDNQPNRGFFFAAVGTATAIVPATVANRIIGVYRYGTGNAYSISAWLEYLPVNTIRFERYCLPFNGIFRIRALF